MLWSSAAALALPAAAGRADSSMLRNGPMPATGERLAAIGLAIGLSLDIAATGDLAVARRPLGVLPDAATRDRTLKLLAD